jgi:hypothetical protein
MNKSELQKTDFIINFLSINHDDTQLHASKPNSRLDVVQPTVFQFNPVKMTIEDKNIISNNSKQRHKIASLI